MARLSHISATCGWGIWVAAFPQGSFCRCYSSAVPPSDTTTGLQDSCCYQVWQLAWPSLGADKLSGMPLPHLGTFGVPWQSMDYTKPCTTMCSFPTTSPSLGSSPVCSSEIPWRHHPKRNLIPEFPLSGLFYSIIPAERAGLANMLSRKGDNGFEGHWPCLYWSPAPSRKAAAPGLLRSWRQVLASWIWC